MGDVIEGQFGKPEVNEEETAAAETPPQATEPGAGLVHQPAPMQQLVQRTGVNPLVVAGIITGTVAVFAIGLYALHTYQKSSKREERRSRRSLAIGEMQDKAKKKVAKKRRKAKPLPARGPIVEVDAD